MARPKRVLSFMSQWGGANNQHKSTTSAAPSPGPSSPTTAQAPSKPLPSSHSFAESATALHDFNSGRASPGPVQQRQRSDTGRSSRPMSMIQTYQPPIMEVGQDTLPELQRIFTFLNSHSNKLYQEGYFLKFHDTDTRGRPAADRKWQEYFVQLVGTIMSLWDASELDQVRGDREVIPTFINLTDAAIHMIPSMTLKDGKKLDHILSVSTAASNKYLLHFDSYHALTQWTAAIRLAIYEHTTLQEAYTGSLIAGKGKFLNNIRVILARENAKYEDWVRVRFGAGTPWRRCWCVVNPPDQKEYAKLQKDAKSKKNPYEKQTILKGDMKFYETKKITKKTKPIATVKDAFACYAIYPQSKPLIDSSTLVKIEGKITVHSQPETTTEGFVFVMPESRPAISGFEIMLQFLFPVFDTFNLYGRPKKLIADVLDTRGLMFAMPSDRRYGYLELWDVTGLINKEGSQAWSERQWRKQLKDLTSTRMSTLSDSTAGPGGRRNTLSRAGYTPSTRNLRFQDGGSIRSQPSTRQPSPTREGSFDPQRPRRVDSAPPTGPFAAPRHQRSVSETPQNILVKKMRKAQQQQQQQSLDDNDRLPTPPQHGVVYNGTPQNGSTHHLESSDTDESPGHEPQNLPELPIAASAPPVGPVDEPPSFAHASNQQPPIRPSVPGSTIKPNPHVDSATLNQMADVSHSPLPGGVAAAGAAAAWKSQESLHNRRSGEYGADRSQQMQLNPQRPVTREGRSQNRMPTIPASPYVEHAEFVQPAPGYEPVAPPVPEHGVPLQSQTRQELPDRPHSGSSGGQITRKPVPGRSSSFSQRSTTSSSLGSLRQDVVDPEALDALNQTETSLFRQQSKSSSRYDDDAVSTSTPDYASTHSEEVVVRKLPARQDRPRSGVLKTIGDPSLLPHGDTTAGASHPTFDPRVMSADMPSIDFGPTYALGFNDKRPGTSGTMTPGTMMPGNEFSRSKEHLAASPNEVPNRNSYISSGRTTPNTALHMHTTSTSPNENESRQVAWQPAMASPGRRASGHKLDAEEWVLHRAAQQSPGLMSYPRQTPTPANRTRSGDWAHLQRTPEGPPSPAARPSSRLTLSRPPSRGAELLLDSKPTTLSAREQEQVARITGTPLLDMSSNINKKHQQQPSQGLTGYIDYREKEKEKAKQQNRHSAAMQAEIDKRMMLQNQRQMQEQQRQIEARQRQMMEMQNLQQQQQQQQMAMAQSMYAQSNYAPSVMGMNTPQALGTPTGMPGMAFSTPGQAQMYAQQAGYLPQQQVTPQMQIPGGWIQTPAQSMQGQYFPQQQTPQQQYMQQQKSTYPPTRPYGQNQQQRR